MSTCTIEEVASSCNAVRFLQIYVNTQSEFLAAFLISSKICFFGSGLRPRFLTRFDILYRCTRDVM
jgi:hypothetical protein